MAMPGGDTPMKHNRWRTASVIWMSAVTSLVLPGFAADPDVLTRVTSHDARDWDPYWSPDGSRLVFTSDRDGRDHLWTRPADGGEARQLTSGSRPDMHPCRSPDGKRVAFASERTGNSELWILDVVTPAPAPRRASGRRIPDH